MRRHVERERRQFVLMQARIAVALDRLTPIPTAHDPVVAGDLFDLDALITSALAELG
jgi:hypothetical protein